MKTKTEIKNIPSTVIANFYREKLKKHPVLREEWRTLERNPYNYLKQIFTHNDNYVKEFVDMMIKELNTITYKDLSKEAQEYMKSQKFHKDKAKLKLLKYDFAVDYIFNNFFSYINNNITFDIFYDFTVFLILIFKFNVYIKNIRIYAESQFEKDFYILFGCTEENFIKEKNDMKFGIGIGNPPYNSKEKDHDNSNNNTDIVFLTEVFKKTTDVLSLVMTGRVLTRRDQFKYRDEISDYCESIYIFDCKDVFDISLPYPLCVITLNKNKNKNTPIHIIDDYYSKDNYYINKLSEFSVLGKLTPEEREELNRWEELIYSVDTYDKHIISRSKEDEGYVYYWIGTSCAAQNEAKGTSKDVIIPKEVFHATVAPKDLNQEIFKGEKTTKYANRVFLVKVKNMEEAKAINNSYKCEMIRWVTFPLKGNHTINKCVVERLPWPVDENGNIKQFTNEDWKRFYNISDSLYKKIMNYYSKLNNKVVY